MAEFFHTGEELYIDAFLNRDVVYWIGLSDFAHEDTWRWQGSSSPILTSNVVVHLLVQQNLH